MSNCSLEGEWNNFIFKHIQPEDHLQLLELIIEHLIPILECIGYNRNEADDWKMVFEHLLNDPFKLHFMATDKETGEIAGFRIIGLMKNGEPEVMPPFMHKTSRIIFQSLVELSDECKIDSYTNEEYYADFFGICVIPKYRKRGLCTEMYKRAISLCKSRGLTMAKISFASPFSRKAGKKNGFKELGRKLCIDFKDENGVPVNPTVDPQWYVDMGVFLF